MEPINHKQHAATWLEIALTYSRQATTLELLITFINNSLATQVFNFSNHTRKAELLGLHVRNWNGQRIMPTHNLLIKPAQALATKVHELASGEAFTYLLAGILHEDSIEFPGAIFKLQAGASYQLQFHYAGQKSNQVELLF